MNHRQIVGFEAITRRDHNCRVAAAAMKNKPYIMDQIGIPTSERHLSYLACMFAGGGCDNVAVRTDCLGDNKGMGIYTET